MSNSLKLQMMRGRSFWQVKWDSLMKVALYQESQALLRLRQVVKHLCVECNYYGHMCALALATRHKGSGF